MINSNALEVVRFLSWLGPVFTHAPLGESSVSEERDSESALPEASSLAFDPPGGRVKF
jgi:hypothetical protein